MVLTCVAAGLLAAGCGGPKATEPKAVGVKGDPRIQRASPGGAATQQPGAFNQPKGKGIE
jgi:hypothetical protein